MQLFCRLLLKASFFQWSPWSPLDFSVFAVNEQQTDRSFTLPGSPLWNLEGSAKLQAPLMSEATGLVLTLGDELRNGF